MEKEGLENIGGSPGNLAKKGLRLRRSIGMLRIFLRVTKKRNDIME